MTWIEFLKLAAAAGIGGMLGAILASLITQFVTWEIAHVNRSTAEKKEAYAGFLSAYNDYVGNEALSEVRRVFGKEHEYVPGELGALIVRLVHWQTMINLVGSPRCVTLVRELLLIIREEKEISRAIVDKMQEVTQEMRKDLNLHHPALVPLFGRFLRSERAK